MNNRRNTALYHSAQSTNKHPRAYTPITKKAAQFFLTEHSLQGHHEQIKQNHRQLNNYIQLLDQKVQKLIQANQSQILLAFKHHLIGIKQEIQEFKSHTLNQMKSHIATTTKMRQLQAQIILLRQQALKLFDLVGQKNHLISKMNIKIQQINSEKLHLANLVKQLSKDIKHYNIKCHNQNNQEGITSNISTYNYKQSLKSTIGMTSYKKSINRHKKIQDRTLSNIMKSNCIEIQSAEEQHNLQKVRKGTVKSLFQNSKQRAMFTNIACDSFLQKFKIKLQQFGPDIKQKIVNLAKQTGQQIENLQFGSSFGQNIEFKKILTTEPMHRSKSKTINKTQSSLSKIKSALKDYNSSFFIKNKKQGQKRNLSEYFKQCLNIVRQQIYHRRSIKLKPSLYNNLDDISLQQFKKVDFFRLLQLFLMNQQIIQIIYDKTFNNI